MTTTEHATAAADIEVRHVALAELRDNPFNVRTEADRTRWTQSIKVNGIQQPIVVRELDDGSLELVAGECRKYSALKAGLTHADVVIDKDASPFDQARNVYVENEHRAGLTPTQRAVAVQQLAGFEGVTQREVAAVTGLKVTQVRESLKVAGSQSAIEAAERHDLTWEQTLVIAEFEGDDEAVETLIAAADKGTWSFDHAASELRQARHDRAAIQAVVDRLTGAGVKVIDLESGEWLPEDAMWIDYLVNPKGKKMTEAQHRSCPGHAAAVIESDDGFEPAYLCLDPAGCGHAERADSSPAASTVVELPSARGLSDEEKAARARSKANNKAWPGATTVRRQFVASLTARRSAPKGTLRFVAEVVLGHPALVKEGNDATLAAVVGKEPQSIGYGRPVAEALVAEATDPRLPLVLFAQVAAACEAPHDKKTGWKEANRTFRHYLAFLESIGYDLSEVEQELVGNHDDGRVDAQAA